MVMLMAMPRIVHRSWPLEKEGELNRTKAELAQATGSAEPVPFTAARTYQAGEALSHAGRVYIANTVIIAGETVRPGSNAMETSIDAIINALNAKED